MREGWELWRQSVRLKRVTGLVAAVVVLPLLIAACSSGLGQTASPTAATPTPATTATTKAGDFLFRAIVREVNRGCEVDARCSVTVDVTESLAGGLPVGQRVTVIDSYGGSFLECYGRWRFDSLEPQDTVEVLANVDTHLLVGEEQRLAICADDSYYVDVIATPTPRMCGVLTCPPTPTPTP